MLRLDLATTPFLRPLLRKGSALCLAFGLSAVAGCSGDSAASGNGTGGSAGTAGRGGPGGAAAMSGTGAGGASGGSANEGGIAGTSSHGGDGGSEEQAGAAGVAAGIGGVGQAGTGGSKSGGGGGGAGGQGGVACVAKSLQANINATSNADLQALAGVTHLTGYLFLSGGITDLSALSCLVHVSGNVALRNLSALVSFAPPQLSAIGGALIVADDAQLASVLLPALTKLGEDVGRSLWLENLPSFSKLDVRQIASVPADVFFDGFGASGTIAFELSSLSSIGGSLSLTGMHLDDVDFFLPLRTVKGSLLIRSGDLRDLGGLGGISEIGRGLTISATNISNVNLGSLSKLGSGKQDVCTVDNLPSLVSLTVGKLAKAACDLTLIDLGTDAAEPLRLDFATLAAVDGGLRLSRIENLGDLSAFPKLATVAGRVLVSENRSLASAALLALSLVQGGFAIEFNDVLTAVSLPSLTIVGGDFRLVHLVRLRSAIAPALSSVSAATLSEQGVSSNAPLALQFGALTKVAQDIALNTLVGLADLSGFANLGEIGGNLAASGNPSLATFELPALTKVGKRLQITDSSGLTTVALPKLASVGTQDGVSFSVSNLPSLTELDSPLLVSLPADLALTRISSKGVPLTFGFAKLTTVGGTLRLDTIRGLGTLTGLNALSTVNGSLLIYDMDALASFAAWTNLTAVRGSLNIRDNDVLPTCQATALVASLASTVSGSFISGNLPDSCSN